MLNSELPRHLQLRHQLFELWKKQGLKIGDKIESQNEIVALCKFSIATVIKTLKDLESQDIIERKVGLGSYLKKTPWKTDFWRFGFFYNREIVGGSILSNSFYGELLQQIETGLLKLGHLFTYGSFTLDELPLKSWNELDAVILTGIDETISKKALLSSVNMAIIDSLKAPPHCDVFGLDVNLAFTNIIKFAKEKKAKNLVYIDAIMTTAQTKNRLMLVKKYVKEILPNSILTIVKGNVEHDLLGKDVINSINSISPDFILGYIRTEWELKLRQSLKAEIPIIYYSNSSRGMLYIDFKNWSSQIIDNMLNRLENPNINSGKYEFPIHWPAKLSP